MTTWQAAAVAVPLITFSMVAPGHEDAHTTARTVPSRTCHYRVVGSAQRGSIPKPRSAPNSMPKPRSAPNSMPKARSGDRGMAKVRTAPAGMAKVRSGPGGMAKVRSGPGVRYRVVARLRPGARVDGACASRHGWVRLAFTGGRHGWTARPRLARR
ncbi:SH3 domain-containing protein [Actinomadura rupiterrae]|uniref:SH3 domain-containing protein n=1 Tax=Actinomadura rupiterrae TaxID=559627 RepID=UPI0020A25FE9|nr:SH3 domain-containing protein [Actinomadura rupiterrae]MCP2339377.1 uncharacterized protein YraI [Actinomadura rupiterrae]